METSTYWHLGWMSPSYWCCKGCICCTERAAPGLLTSLLTPYRQDYPKSPNWAVKREDCIPARSNRGMGVSLWCGSDHSIIFSSQGDRVDACVGLALSTTSGLGSFPLLLGRLDSGHLDLSSIQHVLAATPWAAGAQQKPHVLSNLPTSVVSSGITHIGHE